MKRFEMIGRRYSTGVHVFEVLSYNVPRDILRVRLLANGLVSTISLSLFERCRRAGTVLDC